MRRGARWRRRLLGLALRSVDRWNRARLAWLRLRHPGLEIDPAAGSNLAVARYNLAPDARLRIAAGVVTERIPGRLHFVLYSGAVVEIGENAWLRTEVGDVHLVAFEGAQLRVGPEAFLNGCHLSAKRAVRVGRRAWIGPGTRVFDADQHDLDDRTPERCEAVSIGDHVWIAAGCTVLRGVTIGAHSVIGAHSLVTGEVPPHTLAYGQPARSRARIGDRSACS